MIQYYRPLRLEINVAAARSGANAFLRDRIAQRSNLHRISEMRSQVEVGTDTVAHRDQIGRN